MAKIKTQFVCNECGSNFPKWMGKCSECGNWNSLVEENVLQIKESSKVNKLGFTGNSNFREKPSKLQDIVFGKETRIKTPFEELDRVLGGGVVPGSMVLLGGDPGIGKSTILLQTGFFLAEKGKKVLYVTGEESLQQVRLRAERMNFKNSDNFLLLADTDVNYVGEIIKNDPPDLAIIDSIQAIYSPVLESPPGSVSQVRNSTQILLHVAKTCNTAMIIIGHVTKEGAIAGPKVMEHMVDTVLYFEGERYKTYRLIRAVKNRFGATNEVGLFDMDEYGLKEVTNPSGLFLSEYSGDNSGTCIISTVEGTRPILLELQALAAPTYITIPRRSTIGFEYNRLSQIIAILEKRVGINLSKSDVLVNVVGGMKITEPSADLGAALAVISSVRDIIIPSDMIIMGELGLGGEIRIISQVESRIKEAAKLGFKRAMLPKSCLPLKNKVEGFELIPVSKIFDAIIKLGKNDKTG